MKNKRDMNRNLQPEGKGEFSACFNCCFSLQYTALLETRLPTWISNVRRTIEIYYFHISKPHSGKKSQTEKCNTPRSESNERRLLPAAGNSCSKIVNGEDRERKKENNNLAAAPMRDLYRRQQSSFLFFCYCFLHLAKWSECRATITPSLVFSSNSLQMVRQESESKCGPTQATAVVAGRDYRWLILSSRWVLEEPSAAWLPPGLTTPTDHQTCLKSQIDIDETTRR